MLGTVINGFLKRYVPEYTLPIRICISVLILIYAVADINGVYEKIKLFLPVESEYLSALAKTAGICFIGQWGSSMCRDAGENSLAEKSETVTKIAVTVICLPFIEELFELATMIE